ncbi:response regulator transcription factor [Streptacidiphilus jiangxiensis]|uniref:Transcriptional regulatory protein, C terminal n=1 Tax=Streptacidiphilus jiangxiensis TaxID=235985 RepID=A0A1H7ZZA2_STRJI|nr:Transcriptional regulatory protein, C terminal [Streptacidiphilus jiangxiensis]
MPHNLAPTRAASTNTLVTDDESTGPRRVRVVDERAHEGTCGSEVIELTRTEYALLRHLMRNSRRVLSRGRTPFIHTVRGTGHLIKAPTT